ncbi:hypothetical protein BGZ76_009971 [Entomortierella beljakovae]|nr:hypothetical protein BGZ76_009971 [Entomortierella beljakovae]
MSHLQLGRFSSAAVVASMRGGTVGTGLVTGTYPLVLSSTSSLGLGTAKTTLISTLNNTSRPFLGTTVRNAVAGGLALAGHRGYVSLPDGVHDVGKLVSSATEKIGLGDNQFAAGGFQLALIGGILAGIRVLGSHIIEYLKKQIVVTAEFDSRDESYSWILNWLSDHPYSKNATQFSVLTTIARGAQTINGERIRPSGSTVATSGAAVENITISTLGRSRDLIQSLILEAQRKFIDRDKSRTVIFQADQYGAWRRTKSRPKRYCWLFIWCRSRDNYAGHLTDIETLLCYDRPLDTIVMDSKLKNYIVEDAKEFFASESWYAERGLPFRRGLLLYGTPGTGKTSFIHALAGELGLNIYVVNLSSKNLTDDTLSELVSDTPSRCLLLIEDVDAAFVQRESKDAATGITFSGLLNSVDGVSAQEGRMLCLTTNHLERLDEALIRPGRVDVRARFGKATQSQAKELFIKFYPHQSATATNHTGKSTADPSVSGSDISSLGAKAFNSSLAEETELLASQFAKVIPDRTFSIAQLQGFLMGYKKKPELAVKHVEEFVMKAGSADVSGTAKIGYDEYENEQV